MSSPQRAAVLLSLAVALCACGGARTTPAPAAAAPGASVPSATAVTWPQFGGDAQHSGSSDTPTGLTAANVTGLHRRTVHLPGTVDSAPIYLHGVSVHGAPHNVFVVTTTYGRTLAIDAATATVLWQFVPPGLRSWEGSAQITTSSPAADPDGSAVYAAAPDGVVRKLALSDGRALWGASMTRNPMREKLAASLTVSGGSVLAATGGYLGDAPPYQGHVAAIARDSGRLSAVFNTLCAGRRYVQAPASCRASDSAIFSRAGPVVEAGSGRILITTGNGPYDGRQNFGDSMLELTGGALRLRQAFTPANQSQLNASDTDLGSGGPTLLGRGLVSSGGKDGLLHVLRLSRLNGRTGGRPFRPGGELQKLALPGRAPIFSAGCVAHGLLFVASGGGTRAYRIAGSGLSVAWSNSAHGSSPLVAGGLLYIYDPDGGRLNVYLPQSGQRVATLPAGSGHWNSPAPGDHVLALPEGNANDHATSGTLNLYS